MKIKATLVILAAFCLLFTTLGFFVRKEQDPEKLNLFRAKMDDAGLLQMTLDQLGEGIGSGRVELIRSIVSVDYEESGSAMAGTSGTGSKMSDTEQKQPGANAFTIVLQTIKLLYEKNDTIDSINSENLPKIRLQTTETSLEGNTAIVSGNLEAIYFDTDLHTELKFVKRNHQWKLVASQGLLSGLNALGKARLKKSKESSESGFELYRDKAETEDLTLVRQALSKQFGIDKLTRHLTEEKLDRQLFSQPYSGVLFSSITQHNNAPYYIAKYVQLVTDPAWNRIVYGNYDGWTKAYGNKSEPRQNLNRPHGIDRDINGRIYVADTGNNRIVVLRFQGNGEAAELQFQFAFGTGLLSQPYDVAWDDSGTPFDNSDDIIWTTDTRNHRLLGFALGDENAFVRYSYGSRGNGDGSFFEPKSVAVGKFNGAANGYIYVADSGNRRLAKLAIETNEIAWVSSFSHKRETVFSSLSVDHWGNIYATDRSNSEILKLSEDLQPLAAVDCDPSSNVGPVDFSVVFGSLYVEAEDKQYWAGYDQAFSIEKWTDESGSQRYQLGVGLKELTVFLDEELEALRVASTLTEHAKVEMNVISEKNGQSVRNIPAGWLVPGRKNLVWDRRDDGGQQVEPGYYHLQLTAESTYGQVTTLKESQAFYMPMFYHEDSGAGVVDDPHLIQGASSAAWGREPQQSVAFHPSEVIYHFTNLNPTVEYEIGAQFYNETGNYLKQRIAVDDAQVHGAFEVPSGLKRLEWMMLPRDVYSDGEIDVLIQKVAGGADAMISQLWLREANYDPANAPVLSESEAKIPDAYSLSQNFPNPFNPSTTINFAVPGNLEHVMLRVYNTLGQTVKVLVNGQLSSGRHAIIWNGRNEFNQQVASGVYFYQFSAGDFSQTKKLIFMK